jgi:phosphoribosylglycinamide formyltransferase-1
MNNKKIAILASGSGTNAENIIRFFQQNKRAEIRLLLSNNQNAGVHERAARLGIPSSTFTREEFYTGQKVTQTLIAQGIDLIVLAGFLWLVPAQLIDTFRGRILNIHPALLPAFGGKGMYGSHVHRAVIDAGEKESGITIHLVNEKYDDGDILFQARCAVLKTDTPETLAARIHELEYLHYPRVILELLENLKDR